MKPEEEAQLRALALSLLTQQPAGKERPPEIVVTYRKHEDYEQFVRQIAELQEELKQSRYQIAQLSLYTEENIHLYDQLRRAYNDLRKAGMDVSYITSVKTRNRLP